MANKDWPCGLQPVRMLDGQAPYTTRWPLKQVQQTTKYSTNIYKGQMVLWNGTTTSKTKYVIANAATNPGRIVGVCAEHYFGSVINATKTDLAVWEADKHIFAIQADNTTTTSSLKDLIMKNCNLLNPAAGSTITGLSTSELDYSSAVDTDKSMRVIGVTNEIGEGALGAGINVKCLVRINFGHVYSQAVTIT